MLSQIVNELLELSGLTAQEFSARLGITVEQLKEWQSDDAQSGPSFKKMLKALSVMMTARKSMDAQQKALNNLSQVREIVVKIATDEDVDESDRQHLSNAVELVDKTKAIISDH